METVPHTVPLITLPISLPGMVCATVILDGEVYKWGTPRGMGGRMVRIYQNKKLPNIKNKN